MRTIIGSGLTLIAALAATGCTVIGGPTTNEVRQIDDVTAVETRTSGDLVVLRADEPMLTVTAPESALDLLTSDVEDGTLVLGTSGPTTVVSTIAYLLETDHLDRITVAGSGTVQGTGVTGSDLVVRIAGSGDVVLDGVRAQRVEVRIDGSGDVELTGDVRELLVTVAGSGQVRAEGLGAERADVEIDGSGDVHVDVSGTLDVRINGSGDVRYRGDPQVTSQLNGSGDLTRE